MEINSFKFKKPKLPGPLYEEDCQPKAETLKPKTFSEVSESILASIVNVNAPSVSLLTSIWMILSKMHNVNGDQKDAELNQLVVARRHHYHGQTS